MSSIWKAETSPEVINRMQSNTLVGHVGIEITEIGDDYVRGTMPVNATTHQPMGLLHGGASVVLAETLGSLAANLCVEQGRQYCVGLEINANHLSSVREGQVVGTARPLHIGRSTQVWQIEIATEAGKPVCISRLTMAVKDMRR